MKKTREDKEWREKVINRDGKCIICGKSEGRLNAHHLIPWQFSKYRTKLENGITLCVHHHTLGKFSAHKNPLWFAKWMRENRYGTFYKIMEIFNEIGDNL
jgi:hypothetical protein